MPAASSGACRGCPVASKGRTRIEALLRQSRSLAARFALKLGSTVTMTSVLATPKSGHPPLLFSITYRTPQQRVLVTVRNPHFMQLWGAEPIWATLARLLLSVPAGIDGSCRG